MTGPENTRGGGMTEPRTTDAGGPTGPSAARGRFAPERAILRLARPFLGQLVGAGLLATATELAGLALMATATWLLMTAAGRPPLDRLTVAIVAVRALAVGRGVLRYTERLTGHEAVLRILTDLRARIFATLAARRDTRARSGDALSRLVSDVETVQDLLLRVLVPGAAAVVVGVLAVLGAAVISPAAALLLAAGLLVAAVLLPAVAIGLTRRTAARAAPLRGALAVDAVDLTHGAADLAAFGATGQALAVAEGRARELARLERRLAVTGWAVDGLGVLVSGMTAAAVAAVAIGAGVDGVLVGVLTVGSLSAVEITLGLVTAAQQWAQLRVGLRRVTDLLPPPEGRFAGVDVPHRDRVHLTLDAVTVRYRADAPPALDTVSLDLPPGRRVAVVGPSGAGKSTLLGVLTGAVPPTEGQATVDGIPLDTYDPEQLPRLIGGLLAEAHVFHTTVRDNLLLGRTGVGDDELAAACAAAGLLDWVQAQPAGWDTVVGEGGSQLSGGQRQRLALARAVLAAPAVLVLDEPTEGLDPAAADAVLASTLAAAGDRSVVLVTHRLPGLAGFDEVIVLDSGRIVQRGRHADLIRTPGWYREQWLLQEVAEHGYLALVD